MTITGSLRKIFLPKSPQQKNSQPSSSSIQPKDPSLDRITSQILAQPKIANGLSKLRAIPLVCGAICVGGHMYLAAELPGATQIKEITGQSWRKDLIGEEVKVAGCVETRKMPNQEEFFKALQHAQQYHAQQYNDNFINPKGAEYVYKTRKKVAVFGPNQTVDLSCPNRTVLLQLWGKAISNPGGLTQEFFIK